jgi:hypothetical protein
VTILLALVAGGIVVLVAVVAIGREALVLGNQPRQAHYDLDEAVQYVGDRLPDAVTARITYDDVRALLRWHLEYLRDRDVPARRDLVQGGPAVVEDDEGIAFVLGRADADGLDVTDEEVAAVLDLELGYLGAIGAIGGAVPDPPEA